MANAISRWPMFARGDAFVRARDNCRKCQCESGCRDFDERTSACWGRLAPDLSQLELREAIEIAQRQGSDLLHSVYVGAMVRELADGIQCKGGCRSHRHLRSPTIFFEDGDFGGTRGFLGPGASAAPEVRIETDAAGLYEPEIAVPSADAGGSVTPDIAVRPVEPGASMAPNIAVGPPVAGDDGTDALGAPIDAEPGVTRACRSRFMSMPSRRSGPSSAPIPIRTSRPNDILVTGTGEPLTKWEPISGLLGCPF
jgi:hypothetical protein